MGFLSQKSASGPPAPPNVDAPPAYTQPASQGAGASSSTAPAFRTQFACVTLNMMDRMRFINFPPEITNDLRTTIQGAWPQGIQEERPYGKSKEFKLKGFPWSFKTDGSSDARRLVLQVLEALYDRGWVLQAAVDLSKKEADKGMSALCPVCIWFP